MGKNSLRDQLERAAVSVSNNIAEGFERGTTQELITSQISNLRTLAEGISGQLRAWADNLQNSQIKGQRYLNEKSRREEQRRKQREEAVAEIQQFHEELITRESERRQTKDI